MSELADRLKQELENLKQSRDTLRVQVHLGSKEVQDRWKDAEHHFEQLEQKIAAVGRESRETLTDLAAAADLVIEDLKGHYEAIRAKLS
jgi:SMC interacting uncharacterized protein involved in chromosome segregation